MRQQATGDVLNAITDLYDHSATRYAEPNFFLTEAAEPDDPYWNHPTTPQWSLKNPAPFDIPPTYGIGCPIAWDVTAGENTVKIGIVDSGVEGDHWDLGGPEFPNDTKLVGGWNYADNNNSIGDASDHGTGTAGIAGALTNNMFEGDNFGMAGIAGGWNNEEFPSGSQLYSLKVKHDGGTYSLDAALRAIAFGSDPELSEISFGCHILNCSIPGTGHNETWEDAVYFAYKVGANVVGARGNTGGPDSRRYPACINHKNWAIGVGSYGKDGIICNYIDQNCDHLSSYGYGMDLLAPGTDIPFTSKNGGINPEGGGTSYATPHVSGAIALLRSSDWGLSFELTNEDYENILKYSAFDPDFRGTDGDNWTLSEKYGHGQLRISTPIERLTNPNWSLKKHTRSGVGAYYDVNPVMSYILKYPTLPSEDIVERNIDVIRYDVYVDVTYRDSYVETPYVWGIGHGTTGWSAASPNYRVGWCKVVPDSRTQTGCTLQTFVYKNPDSLVGNWTWLPCPPDEVLLQYRVWGIPGPVGPKVDGQLLPGEISLLGNYPNPFNATTSIEFSIPDKSRVVLSIFDIMGRKVNTLVDKDIAAGEYSVVWDGSDSRGDEVSSGIYYSRLEVADQVKTIKMTMLK